MSSYELTPLAKADIFKIWCYIAKDSVNAAGRVERAIYDACEFLAQAPLRGHIRQDFTSRLLRFWVLTRYQTTPSSTGPRVSRVRSSPFFKGKEISVAF